MQKFQFCKGVLESPGTTAGEVLEALHGMVLTAMGLWPSFWPVVVSETTTEAPISMPSGWSFVPLGEDLGRLYGDRDQLELPEHVLRLPKAAWQRTDLGGGKLPATAAIAAQLPHNAAALTTCRRQAWALKGSRQVLEDLRAIQRRHPTAELGHDPPAAILVAAAGGATGHACTLSGVDFWLDHADGPVCTVLLVGPYCGASLDGYRSERANCARLLLSLQTRAAAAPGRLWVLWLDGDAGRRPEIIREAAAFLYSLLALKTGRALRRALLDGFAIAAGRAPRGHEPPRFLCRVDVHRVETAPSQVRLRRTLAELLSAANGEVRGR